MGKPRPREVQGLDQSLCLIVSGHRSGIRIQCSCMLATFYKNLKEIVLTQSGNFVLSKNHKMSIEPLTAASFIYNKREF